MSTEKSVSSDTTKKQSKHSKGHSEKILAASLVGAVPRPVYFVSPIYIPYVQAPVCYVKSPHSSNKKTDSSKTTKKKDKENQPKTKMLHEPPFRYVAPNCVTPANCVTLPAYNYIPTYSPYYRSNYALRNGQVVPVGVVRAYPQPFVPLTSGWVPYNSVPVQQCTAGSKLNPLSEPYNPHKKSDNTSESNENENNEGRSNCSSPEAWKTLEELSSVSRAATPASAASIPQSCDKCGGQLSGCQETDSGVGDEGDEIVCCCQDGSDSSSSEDAEALSQEEQDQELHIPSLQSLEDEEEFSAEVAKLIEFICEQLQPHEWRAVARELGVSDVVIQCIEYDVYESVCEQMRYVFSYWARSRSLSNLTEDALKLVKNSFAEIGREDLVSALDVTSFTS